MDLNDVTAKAAARHSHVALHPLLLALRDAYRPSVQPAAPLTFAALEAAIAAAATPKPAATSAVGTAPSRCSRCPPPPPTRRTASSCCWS